jgi:hypothetical protein
MIFCGILHLGCGGSDDTQDAFVTDVRVDPDVLRVGEEGTVRVDFEPSQIDSNPLDDTGASLVDSEVVIILPPGVDFIPESFEIDTSDVDGFRARNPNRVEVCGDETRAITYRFTGRELTDNENSIRFRIKPFEGRGEVVLGAVADNFLGLSCQVAVEEVDRLTTLP